MLSDAVLEALQIQMHNELKNSYAYKAFSGAADYQSLIGACKWFEAQSKEEYGHFEKFFTYISDKGNIPKLGTLEGIEPQILTLDQLFERTVALEKLTLEHLKMLAKICREAEDDQTYELVLEFLKEQIEEVKTVEDIRKRVMYSANNILIIDQELGER